MKRTFIMLLMLCCTLSFASCGSGDTADLPRETAEGDRFTSPPAQAIPFGTIDEAYRFIEENTVQAYRREEQEKYTQIIQRFLALGYLPYMEPIDGFALTGVFLGPEMPFEDIHVTYRYASDTQTYAVSFFLFQEQCQEAAGQGLASYAEKRFDGPFLPNIENTEITIGGKSVPALRSVYIDPESDLAPRIKINWIGGDGRYYIQVTSRQTMEKTYAFINRINPAERRFTRFDTIDEAYQFIEKSTIPDYGKEERKEYMQICQSFLDLGYLPYMEPIDGFALTGIFLGPEMPLADIRVTYRYSSDTQIYAVSFCLFQEQYQEAAGQGLASYAEKRFDGPFLPNIENAEIAIGNKRVSALQSVYSSQGNTLAPRIKINWIGGDGRYYIQVTSRQTMEETYAFINRIHVAGRQFQAE